MIHEPEPREQTDKTSKRNERIVVVSMIVCISAWISAASFGFASIRNPQYDQIAWFFIWIWIASMIPIAYFIVRGILDRIRPMKRMKGESKRRTVRWRK